MAEQQGRIRGENGAGLQASQVSVGLHQWLPSSSPRASSRRYVCQCLRGGLGRKGRAHLLP